MRWDLNGFTTSLSKDFLLASYKSKGLIIYSDGSLVLLSDFHQTGSRIEFSRNVKLNVTPSIPADSSITSLIATPDGSRIVLLGPRDIYLVLISPEVMSVRGRNEYFCDCVALHRGFFASHRSVKTSTARLLPIDLGWDNHLAVLFTDCVIRVFSLDGESSEPTTSVDFAVAMPENTDATHGSNRFGLFKSIASFDFVHSVRDPTLIAVDTDGEMYAAYISGADAAVVRPLISPPALPCEPTTLLTVSHPFQEVFSVLSVFSPLSDGIVCHVIAVPNDQGTFDLTLQEKLRVPVPVSRVRLLPSDRSCSYLVATPQRLYLMDIRPWIVAYGHSLTGSGVSSALQDTRLHVLALVLGEESNSDSLGMTSIVDCRSDDGDPVSMFVTRFNQPAVVASFLRCDMSVVSSSISSRSGAASQMPSFKETVIDPTLAKKHVLPQIRGGPSVSTAAMLDETEKWAGNFTENLSLSREAVKLAIKRLADVFPQLNECQDQRNAMNKRVLKLLEDFLELRGRVDQKKAGIEILHNRIESLATRLAGKIPLSTQEAKMLSTLKEYRRQVMSFGIKIPQLSLDVAEERRSTMGPTRSFEPSAASKTANLNRSVCEVGALKARMEKLEESMRQMESESSA